MLTCNIRTLLAVAALCGMASPLAAQPPSPDLNDLREQAIKALGLEEVANVQTA